MKDEDIYIYCIYIYGYFWEIYVSIVNMCVELYIFVYFCEYCVNLCEICVDRRPEWPNCV